MALAGSSNGCPRGRPHPRPRQPRAGSGRRPQPDPRSGPRRDHRPDGRPLRVRERLRGEVHRGARPHRRRQRRRCAALQWPHAVRKGRVRGTAKSGLRGVDTGGTRRDAGPPPETADIGVTGGKIAAIGAPGSLAAIGAGAHRRRGRADRHPRRHRPAHPLRHADPVAGPATRIFARAAGAGQPGGALWRHHDHARFRARARRMCRCSNRSRRGSANSPAPATAITAFT